MANANKATNLEQQAGSIATDLDARAIGVPAEEIFHPLATLFPPMDQESYKQLKADIEVNGQIEPIIMYGGLVADGRHRYSACVDLEREPVTIEWEGTEEELERVVVARNLMRRHLTLEQRAAIAIKMAALPWGANKYTIGQAVKGGAQRQKDIARITKVSPDTVQRRKFIEMHGIPALRNAVDSGAIPIRTGCAIAKLDPREQAFEVAKYLSPEERKDVKIFNGGVRKVESHERRKRTQEEIDAKKRNPGALSKGGNFGLAIVDLPWDYGCDAKSSNCDPNFHYETMGMDEICALPVNEILHSTAIVALWCTAFHLQDCLSRVLPAYGLNYAGIATWDKGAKRAVVGGGLVRQFAEYVVFAKKASPGQPKHRQFPSVFQADVDRTHSRKPDILHEWFEENYPEITSRIELFGRRARDGWTGWGNDPALVDEAA
jgi:N6-adenosine-specific RNA methylase IME4/ParB-like chromosome segregation protein Spo0J